jgi:hypothetical protein
MGSACLIWLVRKEKREKDIYRCYPQGALNHDAGSEVAETGSPNDGCQAGERMGGTRRLRRDTIECVG